MLRLLSRFLRALFQFGKRAAGEATKFGRSGVELLGVVGAARLECGEPAAESGELIRRQLGNNFGDFFYFHGAQYSTGWAWFSDGSDRAGLRSDRCTRASSPCRSRARDGDPAHAEYPDFENAVMSAFGGKADIKGRQFDV